MPDTRNVRVCILRATHDESTIPLDACLAMFLNEPNSVLQYWKDMSSGLLTFEGSRIQPWVKIDLNPFTLADRQTSATKAYDATRVEIGDAVDEFDVYAVLLQPGTYAVLNPAAHESLGQPLYLFPSHAGGAGAVLNGKPACTLPIRPNSHTFFCHELGHTLGLGHSSGVFNDGNDWDPGPPYFVFRVYGDPFDVMSAMTFGSRQRDPGGPHYAGSPTFVAPTPAGWPVPEVKYGPMLARAMAHQWDPRSIPANQVLRFDLPVGGQTYRFRLGSASRNTSLPVLATFEFPHPELFPPGDFRVYVEYRTADGWDRGLHSEGADLARQGVVVHQLHTEDGGPQCFYRGRIGVPLGAREDLKPLYTPLVFHVTDVAADLSSVELQVGLSPVRDVRLDVVMTNDLVTAAPTVPQQTVVTPCGDHLVLATQRWRTTTRFHVATRGYGRDQEPWVTSPSVSWTVDGQPFAPEGTVGTLRHRGPAGSVILRYQVLDDFATIVFSHDSVQPATVQIAVNVSEPDGDFLVTRIEPLTALGQVTGLAPVDVTLLEECYRRLESVGGADNGAQLIRLAIDFTRAGQLELAIGAMESSARIYQIAAAAAPGDPIATLDVANVQHTLTVRLLEAERTDDAATQANTSIAAYSTLVDQPTVQTRLTTELPLFSRELSALPRQSAHAQFVAVTVLRNQAPDLSAGAAARTTLAEGLSTLTSRQIADQRLGAASDSATEAIAVFSDTANLPGADRLHIARELRILAGALQGAGLGELVTRAQQAAGHIEA